jgi:hypothetical protein
MTSAGGGEYSADFLNQVRCADVWSTAEGKPVVVFTDSSDQSLGVIDFVDDVFSSLTEAPVGAKDVVRFDNSPLAWGATIAGVPANRIAWPTGSNYDDWTGIGSGFEDLVDMRGSATRAFVLGDEVILATTVELWRGRKVGGPFRFAWSPITREFGMPFKNAAISTPLGIFWLNNDLMVYHYFGGRITPVGQAIQEELRKSLEINSTVIGKRHFMSYDQTRNAITFHYWGVGDATAGGATRGFTYHIEEQAWTPQTFAVGTSQGLLCSAYGTTDPDFTESFGPKTTYFGTSTGSIVQYSPTAAADLNTGATESDMVSGGIFTGDPTSNKFFDEARLDIRADSASSLTLSVSNDMGASFDYSGGIAISAASNTTQVRLFPKLTGDYFQMRLTSEDTGWEFNRFTGIAQQRGENVP